FPLHLSSTPTSLSTHSIEESGQSSEYQATLASVYPALSHNQRWKLLPNDNAYNNNIRSEFGYEESPNWALCLTLVDLLLSRGMAAACLLDRCQSVSLQLVSDSRDNINREVDQYFVIGVIQNLLWSAKLRFEEATDLSGVEICDTYLSRVDLLRRLVSSRSRVVPSIQELAKPELARRVRDRLVQEDQFELAMEVSTKCQLDTSVVWSAWGVACLRCGELAKAREKFRHCFQMSSQRGSGVTAGRRSSGMGGAGTQQLLERIVEQLEQSPLSITTKCAQPTEDWSSVMMACMSLTEKHSEDCDLDTHRFSECLHYLQSHGGQSATVAFFVRHNCWTDACKYILDERCSEEVFVEQLWVPALKAGVIEKVQDILKALNHSLVHWEPYLTAVCRHFSQRSLYHILYQTQLYMRDFIRAGMTCIKFFIGFSGRSTTITDLFSRRHYLITALRHFQSALDAKQRAHGDRTPGVGRGRGGGYLRSGGEDPHLSLATSTKNMSVSDLKSHITTIELQMRVTEFLYRCAKASNSLQTPLTSSGEGGVTNSSGGVARKLVQPVTLFSSGHMRAEVAVQLMLRSQDILEGFELAHSIVTTYRLPTVQHFLRDVARSGGSPPLQRHTCPPRVCQQELVCIGLPQ
ncbi:Zinc finger FYVE domain-containing protein 26, partial [Geodia barretti]